MRLDRNIGGAVTKLLAIVAIIILTACLALSRYTMTSWQMSDRMREGIGMGWDCAKTGRNRESCQNLWDDVVRETK